MSTINGFGTMLYGMQKVENSSSYISTKWFVLFFIPLFPISTYVIINEGKSEAYSSNNWFSFGVTSEKAYTFKRIPFNFLQIIKTYLIFWIPLLFFAFILIFNNQITQTKVKQQENEKQKIVEKFDDYIKKQLLKKFIKKETSNPYLKERILPINLNTGQLDEIYFNLPQNLLAQDTNNIKTLIELQRFEEAVGKYSDNTDAIHRTCNVKIIDLESHNIIFENSFNGVLPPKQKKHKGDDLGSDPVIEIVDFIKALPKK